MPVDIFICPDCELPVAEEGSLCEACAAWRAQKLAAMDSEYEDRLARQARRRMKPSERFAEGLSDLVKAAERSRR
jgi:hypothetical protein